MSRTSWIVALVISVAGGPVLAHHSYAAFHMDRTVEIEGVLEAFEWISPHTLVKVRTGDGRLYAASWLAPQVLQRNGIAADTLRAGDRIVVTGNPHRAIDRNGVLNLWSVRRDADGWTWSRPPR